MLLKKCRRTAQNGMVEGVTEVGDQAVAGIIHQICSGVIKDSFQNCGGDERIRDHRPRIVKMRGHEFLQINGVMGMGDSEQQNVVGARGGIQYAIKHGAN